MPLPFIIGGVIAAAAAVTAKKGYDGYQDSSLADEIIERAERKQKEAKDEFEYSQRSFTNEIESLGKLRLEVAEDINNFQKLVEKLKKLFAESDNGRIKLDIKIPDTTIRHIEAFTATALAVSSGALSGAATGAAAGYAIYGGVMALGAASTGTAISTLSGVAATNAALAAIGGGSLAAGGLGVAGGTALLGGVVAAPVLAFAAWSYASKAEEKLDKAREFRDQIDDEIVPKLVKGKEGFKALEQNIYSLRSETVKLRKFFQQYYDYLINLDQYIVKTPPQERKLDPKEKDVMQNGMRLAEILTNICTVLPLKLTNEDKDVQKDSLGIPYYNEEVISVTLQNCETDKKKIPVLVA